MTRASTSKEAARSLRDEICEAFKDPVFVEAIGPYIAKAIESSLEKKLGSIFRKLNDLEETVKVVKDDNTRLQAIVIEQGNRLEVLEIYSRAHDLIVRRLPESTYAECATASSDGSSSPLAQSHSAVAEEATAE